MVQQSTGRVCRRKVGRGAAKQGESQQSWVPSPQSGPWCSKAGCVAAKWGVVQQSKVCRSKVGCVAANWGVVHQSKVCRSQCCGSGMFIPDPGS
jgi:hypothetical protein